MSKNSFRRVSFPARRAVLAPATAGMIALSLLGAPAASAQTVPSIENLSSDAQAQLDNFVGQTREQAWNTRNQILDAVEKSNPQAADAIQPAVDAAVNALFPGLIDQKNAEIRAAQEAQIAREREAAEAAKRKAEEERRANEFDRGPCPADARVCVDLDGRRTWLQEGGNVSYVASAISSGKPGEETPSGTFYINRKVENEISREFGNAPMPYSMYFTNNGHAFHEGDPNVLSNGCIHLTHQDAVKFWNEVPVGSKVFIY
ncbi:L,D-transpeptidase [Corynebacterium sp.]|uniref:L,D-transpeptidase n=1 Tax=Corynebacterium sp. TaxID=1720 RepID=UPI0026DA6FA7|nr:L,D-transpeptidase [Corynebacterium sp.]MDO5032322.1 L,D-transpeptidase [Corynebacterium sp.]